MARASLRRTSVLAVAAATAGAGIVLTAAPASADIYSQIRQCESGGNYATNTGNGYYGAYQFTQQTWNSLGYSGLPSSASPATQDAAAAQLAARSGFGQWPVCGAGGGGASYSAPAQTYTPQQSYTPTYSQPSYSYNSYSDTASRDYTRPAVTAPVVTNIYGWFTVDNGGQTRPDVKLYQQALRKRHYPVKVNGRYDELTVLATLAFQKTHHLHYIDGIVGPETWKAVGLKPVKTLKPAV